MRNSLIVSSTIISVMQIKHKNAKWIKKKFTFDYIKKRKKKNLVTPKVLMNENFN